MDLETILILSAIFVTFAISTITDVVIFRKLIRTKKITTENNREIYDHDKTIIQLKDAIKNIKNK